MLALLQLLLLPNTAIRARGTSVHLELIQSSVHHFLHIAGGALWRQPLACQCHDRG
jgi:hypothetical protein